MDPAGELFFLLHHIARKVSPPMAALSAPGSTITA